jgi:CBS domain-containing protein
MNLAGSDECQSCHQDLASLNNEAPKNKMAKSLMSDCLSLLKPKKPVTVSPDATVFDAITLMNETKIGCILVTQGSELKGILTERDILFRVLGKHSDLKKIVVSEVMTHDAETLSQDDSLAYAVNKMSVGGYRHIPVTTNGQLNGIISVRDVLRHLSLVIN